MCIELDRLKTGREGSLELTRQLHLQHRTIQALVVETLLKGIAAWAIETEQEGRYDARNVRAMDRTLTVLKIAPPDLTESSDEVPITLDHLTMYTC